MNCKNCKKDILMHDLKDLAKCLYKLVNIEIGEAEEYCVKHSLVQKRGQPGPNKSIHFLRLANGETVTGRVPDVFVMAILAQVDKPHKPSNEEVEEKFKPGNVFSEEMTDEENGNSV